jgi:1-deoxy-D-xylulose-5-phosphate synthase
VLAPGDEHDLTAMLDWALMQNGPMAIRYPTAVVDCHAGDRQPIELGRSELLVDGHDGLIVACGTLLGGALEAATRLREEGLDVGVVNARFVKPLDARLPEWIEAAPWVVTVEENALQTGFGSAVLEAVNDAGVHAGPIKRLGIPDRFVEHGERSELLADLGLDAAGIAAACRQMAGREPHAAADTATSQR